MEARKEFYARAEEDADSDKEEALRLGKLLGLGTLISTIYMVLFAGKVVVPVCVLLFTLIYWAYGLFHYFK